MMELIVCVVFVLGFAEQQHIPLTFPAMGYSDAEQQQWSTFSRPQQWV